MKAKNTVRNPGKTDSSMLFRSFLLFIQGRKSEHSFTQFKYQSYASYGVRPTSQSALRSTRPESAEHPRWRIPAYC